MMFDTSDAPELMEPEEVSSGHYSRKIPVVEASPQPDKPQDIKVGLSLALIIATVGLVLGFIIGFSKTDVVEFVENPTGMAVQVQPPVFNSTSFARDWLPEYTQTELLNPDSAQSKALEWVTSDTLMPLYSVDRRLQRFALATMYFATQGGHRWSNNSRWISAGDECDWHTEFGVESLVCDEKRKYQVFNLAQVGLQGEIPNEIGFLTNLVSLRLQRNQLTGSLPSTLDSLTRLRDLNAAQSKLTGTIPASLGKLQELRTVRFFGNKLSHHVSGDMLRYWNKVTKLDLGNNSLIGPIPTEIGELKSAKFLYLDINSFTGTIPEELCSLTNLRHLWLDTNSMRGTIPSCLGNLNNLSRLLLYANMFSGSIPDSLCERVDGRGLHIAVDCSMLSCSCDCHCADEERVGNATTGSHG